MRAALITEAGRPPTVAERAGVLDLSDPEVETADVVAARERRAFAHTTPERIVMAPDCGMKYLPRDSAEGKMRALAGAATLLRRAR